MKQYMKDKKHDYSLKRVFFLFFLLFLNFNITFLIVWFPTTCLSHYVCLSSNSSVGSVQICNHPNISSIWSSARNTCGHQLFFLFFVSCVFRPFSVYYLSIHSKFQLYFIWAKATRQSSSIKKSIMIWCEMCDCVSHWPIGSIRFEVENKSSKCGKCLSETRQWDWCHCMNDWICSVHMVIESESGYVSSPHSRPLSTCSKCWPRHHQLSERISNRKNAIGNCHWRVSMSEERNLMIKLIKLYFIIPACLMLDKYQIDLHKCQLLTYRHLQSLIYSVPVRVVVCARVWTVRTVYIYRHFVAAG